MRDTLAANTFRALAAIVALGQFRDDDEHLHGCLQEAMRLWPTTPLLGRETTRNVTLAGEPVPEGTQILILNTFNHRDTDAVPDADRFHPERWASGEADPRFNHLSNGSQSCPGGPLVYLLGKAVLAGLVTAYDLRLVDPELDVSGAVPHMLDFFSVRFAVQARERARLETVSESTPRG
jgi:cytochrome P450